MDEYLSKPLQQNHLIQTILKCATLGGALLEKNRERELARSSEQKDNGKQNSPPLIRPSLEGRSITSNDPLMGSMDSPALVTTGPEDPLQRARSTLSEPCVHND